MFNISPDDRSKSYKRYVVEFLVIFLSVVLAFFIENFRESMNEKSQYKEALEIFGNDLDEQIQEFKEQTDSFRIANHDQSGGNYYEVLNEFIWFDSLLKNNRATMDHFRYMIEQGYLFTNYLPLIIKSPLAKEIRLKYGEHASGRVVKRYLLRYESAMEGLETIEKEQDVIYEKLNTIADHIDFNLEFSDKDSLILYSNEFRWSFKRLLDMKKWDYYERRWLGNDRFVSIMDGLLEEATMFGFLIPEDKLCWRMKDFKERHACWWGKSTEEYEVVHVDEIIKEKHAKFFGAIND